MNAVGQQMASWRAAAPAAASARRWRRPATIEACDGVSPWGVWASALGGLGSAWPATATARRSTYNFGGAAAGIDYRVDPRFLVGLRRGYAAGNQWVDSFIGPRLDRHA